MIPYGRQNITKEDIDAVLNVLSSDWLTTGPEVASFESALAEYVGAKNAVAVNSGTAALHCAMYAIGIENGDEVILPTMTFAATANCVVYQGGVPVFADVDENKLLVDVDAICQKITPRTKAVLAVDYAGHPCNYQTLRSVKERNGLKLIADGCHALGAEYKQERVGRIADLTAFSFHPVKHITTGEGGMITTDNEALATRIRRFRNHGITTEHHQRTSTGSWFYEMEDLGYNYRITDIQCALGKSQLKKLPEFLRRRNEIAYEYINAFRGIPEIKPLTVEKDVFHAYHLFVVRIDFSSLSIDRSDLFRKMRAKGIVLNVHYIPVHLHPYYRKRFGTGPGLCPRAEAAYQEILSLPIFPLMTEDDVQRVIDELTVVVTNSR